MDSYFPLMHPTTLLSGTLILVIIVIIFGYRNRESGRRYWASLTFKVVIVIPAWWILHLVSAQTIMIYTGDPIEQRLFNINIVNVIVYFGLTLLLALSEIRRSQPNIA